MNRLGLFEGVGWNMSIGSTTSQTRLVVGIMAVAATGWPARGASPAGQHVIVYRVKNDAVQASRMDAWMYVATYSAG